MEKIRSQQWGKISNGDLVKVKGERGQFTFISHVRTADSDQEWVDVYGGSNGFLMFRSFDPSKVRPVKKKRGNE